MRHHTRRSAGVWAQRSVEVLNGFSRWTGPEGAHTHCYLENGPRKRTSAQWRTRTHTQTRFNVCACRHTHIKQKNKQSCLVIQAALSLSAIRSNTASLDRPPSSQSLCCQPCPPSPCQDRGPVLILLTHADLPGRETEHRGAKKHQEISRLWRDVRSLFDNVTFRETSIL